MNHIRYQTKHHIFTHTLRVIREPEQARPLSARRDPTAGHGPADRTLNLPRSRRGAAPCRRSHVTAELVARSV